MARGGKRPGAGRPPGKRSAHHQLATDQARTVLAEVDTIALWKKFLHSPQVKVAADCLQYLYDRAYGRPAQLIQGGTAPIKIEFGWSAETPQWLAPEWRAPAVETRAIPQQLEAQLVEAISQIEEENEE
jgi:hypothetical protein